MGLSILQDEQSHTNGEPTPTPPNSEAPNISSLPDVSSNYD